ncbi:MAG: DUF3800 domain-containing protein [Verrucomicrobiota bacterium]
MPIIHLYCDERGHLPFDRETHLALGALRVPRECVKPLTQKLRAQLSAMGWPAGRELKWTKVSPAGLKFYESALDFFLREPDLRFRALLAPKSLPPGKLPKPPAAEAEPGTPAWEAYHALLEQSAPATVDFLHRYEAWYYDRYFELLSATVAPPAHHAIYVDVKDTRGGTRLQTLEKRLADAHCDGMPGRVIDCVRQIRSEEVLLDQLVDLLLGCLAWTYGTPQRNAGHLASPAKSAMAKRLQSAIATPEASLVPKVVIAHSPERSPAA